ncbi:MAG TPA: substrate-binding domain-containing protein [Thermomicrobiales bacterium]|nr:substrate-binding domain-containing protein [Thermomicrobiales bacterium]
MVARYWFMEVMMSPSLDRRTMLKGAAAASLMVPAVMRGSSVARAQDTIQVAYITPGLNVPFWKYLSDGIKQSAASLGAAQGLTIQVTDYDSRNSAETQLQNAQDVVTAGVDVIIISPTDSSTCPAVLEVAAEAKVPVIIADIGTDSGDYASFVISTNEQGAYEAGQVLVNEMKAKGFEGADILMIAISQARQNGKNRTAGVTKAIEEGGSKIVQMLQSENYTRAEAQGQALDLMTANSDAHGFFSQHDEATLGTWAAIEDSDNTENVILVGFDGSPESVELIRAGKLRGASMQQPVLMGRMSMEVGLKVVQGEEVEKETSVPTILVTPDNLASVEATLADTVFPVEGGAATPEASPSS